MLKFRGREVPFFGLPAKNASAPHYHMDALVLQGPARPGPGPPGMRVPPQWSGPLHCPALGPLPHVCLISHGSQEPEGPFPPLASRGAHSLSVAVPEGQGVPGTTCLVHVPLLPFRPPLNTELLLIPLPAARAALEPPPWGTGAPWGRGWRGPALAPAPREPPSCLCRAGGRAWPPWWTRSCRPAPETWRRRR